ncbi:MAG: hypothetical protein ABF593_04725 [Acetobacter papayae]|uniref:hypothetical protein n=1 Tax=Acetobacter papayae TaxID=1076592 RepID=UPI0039E8D3C5
MGAIAIAPPNFIGHSAGERILAMTRFLVSISPGENQPSSSKILSLPSEVLNFVRDITPPDRLDYIEDGETGKRWTSATLHTFYPSKK